MAITEQPVVADTGSEQVAELGRQVANLMEAADDLTSYTDGSGTPGNATANTYTGRHAIAAAASAVTITNNLVSATSVVSVQLEDADGTATRVVCVPGNGSFVVTANAAATAATKFRWSVLDGGPAFSLRDKIRTDCKKVTMSLGYARAPRLNTK